MASDEKMLPVKPIFFDKKKLGTKEFKNYIYEIEFKKSGKKVNDMNVAGYIHALSPYLKGIHSELIHYGVIGDGRILRAVVRSTVTVSFKTSEHSTGVTNDMTFTALADGDVTNAPSSDTLVRTVETRALKRALARVMDISKADLNEDFVEEDEIGTPLNTNGSEEDKEKPVSKTKALFNRADEKKRKEEREIAEAEGELGGEESLPVNGDPDIDW